MIFLIWKRLNEVITEKNTRFQSFTSFDPESDEFLVDLCREGESKGFDQIM